jgi:2-amino-4-hydroxy-6-hydroxymethyldihydropteridine diphosphokinase
VSAVQALDALEHLAVVAVSSVYETEPVGEVTEQRDFYNAVAEAATALDPHSLLEACKKIELDLGRTPGGPRHGPRPIDIDLLLMGETQLAEARLTLPHPDLANRRFVLEPLVELRPDLMLPDGRRAAALLAALPQRPRVAKAEVSLVWR